jgi:integration host factor subunit alpha
MGKKIATLEHAESVKLSGFGKFELSDKVARPGRNPKTGEEIHQNTPLILK